MNILLIAPAAGQWRGIGQHRVFNGRTFRFSMLSLLSVAALSPKDARVTIIDEQVDAIPDEDFDLVGITAMTALASRAYELCAHFRGRAIPVVLGGFHATLNPEEALQHADAIVRGPAYGAWERVSADVQAGTLQREYQGSLADNVPAGLPRHLIRDNRYLTVNATFATLGCLNRCNFCSINPFHNGVRYQRPVEEVVTEVAAFKQKFFIFVDDNLTQDPAYALALFRGLAPLNKRWVTQVSVDAAEDGELLEAMQRSGCVGVFIGLESFNGAALNVSGKGFNKPEWYRDLVERFHRHGMYVEAGIIVGFDNDEASVFRSTLDMLDYTGIDAIQLSILTPLPGTPLHRAMESRLHDTDWSHYDFRHAVFAPKRMTPEVLQAGADWMIRTFYAPSRILRRLACWIGIPGGWRRFMYPLALNLAYLGRVLRFHIRGADPLTAPEYVLQDAHLAGNAPSISSD